MYDKKIPPGVLLFITLSERWKWARRSGALVARGENVSELELKSGSGIYVVRCQKDGLQTAVKIAIR